jgi:tetratricopeptide (TPR) repeat protein
MYLRASFLPLLPLLLVLFQSPDDSIRRHYESAEAARRAGNLSVAEARYRDILSVAYHKLGRIHSAQSDYQRALTTLETAATYSPRSTEVLVDLSIAYFNAGQYRKAVEPLDRALASDARSVAAHHMLGKSYFMLGEFERAGAELETALKLAPKDYDVAYTLALAYLKQRRVPPARGIFESMLAALGNRPQLRVLIGRAYRETGYLAEAIDEFNQAIALDPHFPRVHYYLGLTYLLKDGAARLGDAEREFKMELAKHPGEYFANFYLGIVNTIERRWETALGFLQEAARIEPNNPDPYFYLGQTYQGLERHEQAIDMLRKSIALNPALRHNDNQVTNAHYRLGQSLLKIGRREEGEKELELAAELKTKAFKKDEAKTEAFINAGKTDEAHKLPGLVSAQGLVAESSAVDARTRAALQRDAAFYAQVIATAHNNIGLLRAEQGDFRAAAAQFKSVAEWNPRQEDLDYNLGLAHFKSESYREAVPPLEKVLRQRPDSVAVKHLLGLSYFMTENFAGASALLSDVVAAKPREAALYFPLALSLSKQGKTEAANLIIKQMVTMGGDSPQLHILLGQAYSEQGDSAKALAEIQAALALDSKVRLAHFYAGVLYLKMGKYDEAVREFESELALNPGDVQARYHLGYVLLARQDTEKGIRLMREVIEARPDFANARFELGKALLQRGDLKGAVESLEMAAKLEPGQPHVHYQLGRAYLAAGRTAEGESQLEISRQMKEKARKPANQ